MHVVDAPKHVLPQASDEVVDRTCILGGRWRRCFSDQHYFASLLSYKALENETACNSTFTNHLSHDPQHAHIFTLEEVSNQGCVITLLIHAAMLSFSSPPVQLEFHALLHKKSLCKKMSALGAAGTLQILA